MTVRLTELIEAVRAGTAHYLQFADALPDRDDRHAEYGFKAFHGDLNAAKDLHDALLPGYFWNTGQLDALDLRYAARVSHGRFADSSSWRGFSMIPARAWLLAILTAYQAKTDW